MAPRPIGWITSMSAKGEINLAPYSFSTACRKPADGDVRQRGRKDSVAFIEETGEFVCNLATWDLRDADERDLGAAARAASTRWSAPGLTRRAVAPGEAAARRRSALRARMQAGCRPCRSTTSTAQPLDGYVVFGQVVGVHIDDRFIENGLLDTAAMKPIARCGYHDYAVVSESFTMRRPASS